MDKDLTPDDPTLPTIRIEDIGTSPVLADAIASHGGCVLEGAIDAGIAVPLLIRARAALDLPEELLLPYWRTHRSGGYVPPGGEYVRGDAATCRMYDLVSDHFGPTRFPKEAAPLETSMRRAYHRARSVASFALRALDAAWGTSLERDAYRGPHMLRTFFYASGPEVRFPEHRDFGLVSLFVAESAPGLECVIDGAWTPIAVPHGAMLLAAGTALLRYRKGIRPLTHRVIGGVERDSAVFFAEARADVTYPDGTNAGKRFDAQLVKALRLPS